MKLLSFAIPCYNSAEYMEKCIKSCLAGGDDIEVIIVDDGSTKDNTLEIAKKYDIDVNLLNDIIGEYEYSGILDTGKIKEKIDKPLIEKVNITKSIKEFIVNLINRFK